MAVTQIHQTEFAEQGSTPSTPASSRRKIYPTTTGWADLDDAGTETNFVLENVSSALLASQFILDDGSELTIASATITVTNARHTVDTESDAASDDLDTINGLSAGEIALITANNASRDVVLKHASDNITCSTGADITLDDADKQVLLIGTASGVYAFPLFGSASGVGGTLGATDNAIPRADGTGGSTLQASGLTINDSDTLEMADNVIERAEMLDYSETVATDTDSGATHTIDITTGNVHQLTLTANCTLTFSNPSPTGKACSFTLIVTQDGTGSRTLTYPASVDWAGGSAPTLTTDANAVDILTFLTTDAGTTWYGFLAGLDFS